MSYEQFRKLTSMWYIYLLWRWLPYCFYFLRCNISKMHYPYPAWLEPTKPSLPFYSLLYYPTPQPSSLFILSVFLHLQRSTPARYKTYFPLHLTWATLLARCSRPSLVHISQPYHQSVHLISFVLFFFQFNPTRLVQTGIWFGHFDYQHYGRYRRLSCHSEGTWYNGLRFIVLSGPNGITTPCFCVCLLIRSPHQGKNSVFVLMKNGETTQFGMIPGNT